MYPLLAQAGVKENDHGHLYRQVAHVFHARLVGWLYGVVYWVWASFTSDSAGEITNTDLQA
jgi:hypothetical protein